MSSTTRLLRRVALLVLVAALSIINVPMCLTLAGAAMADWVLTRTDIGDQDDDFDHIDHYRDSETGEHLVRFWWKDGTTSQLTLPPRTPKPNDSRSAPKRDDTRVLPSLRGTIPLGNTMNQAKAKSGAATINDQTKTHQTTSRPNLPRVPEAWDRWPECRQTSDC